MSSASIQPWREAFEGFARRQRKHLGHLRHGWLHARRACWILGCQRSGTTMVGQVLDRHRAARVYHENHAIAFADFQLRSPAVVRAVMAASPAPSQVFKPICDSQDATALLDGFPGSRAVWVFRRPDDVANSAVAKWQDHQLQVVSSVAAGEMQRWGWRSRGLAEQALTEVRRVYRQDLSAHEGALLFWYLRNSLFFSQGLDSDPRVVAACYEQLVDDPVVAFAPVFAQAGLQLSSKHVAHVDTSSVGRAPAPECSEAIRALVDGMYARLRAWRPVSELVQPVWLTTDNLNTGGAERYVCTVANWLVDNGVETGIIAGFGELNPTLDERVDFRDVDLDQIRATLVPATLAFRRALQGTHPAVFVGNSLATTWIARLASLGSGVPVVNVAHGWPENRYRVVAPLMRAADHVVAVSPAVKAQLVASGLPEEYCTVVFNGVDCTPLGPREGAVRTRCRAEMGASEHEVLVAVVGRLSAQKAHQHVISLAVRCPLLRFAIIGDGERRAELEALVAEHRVGERVRLLGMRDDVPDLLGSADVYLCCSDWEGMSLAIIEGMAAGLPIVSTHTEGADQLLTDTSGIVVPVADVEGMATALKRLAQDAALRLTMGAEARERALSEFSHERMCAELTGVLARVVQDKAHR